MEKWKASMGSHQGSKQSDEGMWSWQKEKSALWRKWAMQETVNILRERKIAIDFYSKLGHLKDIRKIYCRVTGQEETKENVLWGSLDERWLTAGVREWRQLTDHPRPLVIRRLEMRRKPHPWVGPVRLKGECVKSLLGLGCSILSHLPPQG